MKEGVDLAGVIGTWTADFLALIALFGVVAPILLIRRARSERHVALSSIDDRHHEFIHPGLKVLCISGIGRKITVPNLETPPNLMNHTPIRREKLLDEKRSGTDWIMFIRTLKAYINSLPPGGTLDIDLSQSWLPVHRLWVFTLGLLGRYAYRPDHGRRQNAPPRVRIDQSPLEALDQNTLYGITGFLRFDSEFGRIYFRAHDKDSRASLQPDPVPISTLFWLCMGCVPLRDRRVFDISRDLERDRLRSRSQNQRSQTAGPSNDDAISTHSLYRFKPIENPALSGWVISWAQTLFHELPEIWWMCEYEVKTPEERADVAHIPQNPNDSEGLSTPWIKTKSLKVDEYFNGPSLLWRSDVQSLVLGVLTMDWSPRGHLFDVHRGGFFRKLIRPASKSLQALLEATCRFCENTTLASSDQVDLIEAAKNMLPLISSSSPSRFSRTRHEALYNLEQSLKRNYNLGIPSMAVGVMFLTSKTFRDCVLKSVREAGSNDNILSLNQVSKTLVITEQGDFLNLSFALDYEEVFGEAALPTPTFLTFKTVLFAALQACVRCTEFYHSFDSTDLLHFVEGMDDVVYVAATSSMWNLSVARRGARHRIYSPETPSEMSSDESVTKSTASEPDGLASQTPQPNDVSFDIPSPYGFSRSETEYERIGRRLARLERRVSGGDRSRKSN